MLVHAVTYNFTYENVPNAYGTHLEKQPKFDAATVGYGEVEKIEYHTPAGPGDQHYCDIYYKNGNSIRVFNINQINFLKEKDE